MFHLIPAAPIRGKRGISGALLAATLALPAFPQSAGSPAGDTLKVYADPLARNPLVLSGKFGAGLFHSTVPGLTPEQAFSPAVLLDSRGLDSAGNLPANAPQAPYRIRPMALASARVTADLQEEILVLDGPSVNGWTDSARFLVLQGMEGKGYLAPRAARLPAGTYADMLRLLSPQGPIAFLKRTDSLYSLEIFRLGALLCGSEECPAPAAQQSIPLAGVPTTVLAGDFNHDSHPDLVVSLGGHPGRVQVLLGGPDGFPESSRRILATEGRFPLRNTVLQNRLHAARNIAVGAFLDSSGSNDTLPDLVVATCDSLHANLGWRLEVFRNFAVDAAPRRRTLPWIASEQYEFINLMFADADGDGREDFLEMHREGSDPLPKRACCDDGGLARLEVTVWRGQANGKYRDKISLSAWAQRPLGLTPFPFDASRFSTPLFATAFLTQLPGLVGQRILPPGISLFQFNPLHTQGVFPKGTLRGGPLVHLNQQPVLIDRGARLAYAVQPEPGEAGIPGIGILDMNAYFAFLAPRTSHTVAPEPIGMPQSALGAAEFRRGKQTHDALGRVRRKAGASRPAAREFPAARRKG